MLRKHNEASLTEAIEVLRPYLVRNLSIEESKDLRVVVQTWRKQLLLKYKAKGISGKLERFLKKEELWLNTELKIPTRFLKAPPSGESSRAKRRRVSHVSSQQNEAPDILLLGTAKTLAKIGTPRSTARSKLLKQLAKRKEKAVELLNSISSGSKPARCLTDVEGLQLLLELDLTKAKYETLHRVALAAGHKFLPSYKSVIAKKQDCRPPKEFIRANEKGACVDLASLLKHTCSRIVKFKQPEIHTALESSQTPPNTKTATMLFTWGMDGAGSQSLYKQRGEQEGFVQESHLFVVSVSPVQFSFGDDLLWKNPKPQSPFFCRPVKIVFEKEDKQLVLQERDEMLDSIGRLEPFTIDVGDLKLMVNFELRLTMVDGKILSYLTETSAQQNCPICHSTPSQLIMQNIGTVTFVPEPGSLEFGISPLHALIRIFECCLHLSYRLNLGVWKVQKPFVEEVKQRKRMIQRRMFDELGLRVDFPNAGGGNSNDGNTARRAFENIEKMGDILGLNKHLLLNFRRILLCLTCQLPIHPTKFGDLCTETAYLFHTYYPWYYMPCTLHKVLIHGRAIMENCPLPLGVMGEDAQESRHKLFRKYRLHHSRLSSRSKGNSDIFNRSLETSDPFLSSTRLTKDPKMKRRSLDLIASLLLDAEAALENHEGARRELFSVEAIEAEEDPFHEYFDEDIPVENEVEI